MPTIERIGNCKICIYADDHNPPHFHVLGPDLNVRVVIETLEVLDTVAGNQSLAKVMDYARDNRDALLEKWRELNEREP